MRPRHKTAENTRALSYTVECLQASMRPRHKTAENPSRPRCDESPMAIASMRPRHKTAENRMHASPREYGKNAPVCEHYTDLGIRLADHGVAEYLHSVKEPKGNKELPNFERCLAVWRQPSTRASAASDSWVSVSPFFPVSQTMMGSRATAAKLLPRLSTLGETLSAGPRSTIRT